MFLENTSNNTLNYNVKNNNKMQYIAFNGNTIVRAAIFVFFDILQNIFNT